MASCCGSPPRVRGKRRLLARPRRRARLIPAHAGKTPTRGTVSERDPAHPRACGENLGGQSRVDVGLGSSRRVRGKRTKT